MSIRQRKRMFLLREIVFVWSTRQEELKREIERNSKEKWLENGQQILLVRRSHDST